jgi:SAM-dependent methyltransferase
MAFELIRKESGSDSENLVLADGWESVDLANREFYARFPYPWPPKTFPRLEDEGFEAVMLNQSLGDFSHRTVRPDARLWVAGCGTNQAVYTALRFPQSAVIGSDLSPTSLHMCERTAASLGLRNLTLRQESLNEVSYREAFDYIICTGVIHHNAEPAKVLATLARALRPQGVLELMVYNRFQRTPLSAFQRAVRAVTRHEGRPTSYEEELAVARALSGTQGLALGEKVAAWLRDTPESQCADALIQPVEYSYTVESLNRLAHDANLQLLLPCFNQFDQSASYTWSVRFATRELQDRIDDLPDVVRWQIVNLLFMERSPMLWFLLTPRREPCDEHYERRVNDAFLDRRFVRASTTLRNYVRDGQGGGYTLSASPVTYPAARTRGPIRDVIERADGARPMRQILDEVGIDVSSQADVAQMRVQTTTSLCPYLRAV